MNFLRKFLLISFSLFINCVPLKSMEQEDLIKIFIFPYTIEDSAAFVLGRSENYSEWKVVEDKVSALKIKHENYQMAIANAILYKQKVSGTSLESKFIEKLINKEAARIFHQQTFGLFAKKENPLKNISDSDNIKYFIDKINAETGAYYIDESSNYVIFFIEVPYIDCSSFNVYREDLLQKLNLPEYNKSDFPEYLKKNIYMWIKIDDLSDCVCEDPELSKLLEIPAIKDIITTLKDNAKIDSDGVETQKVDISDDEE